MVPFWRVDIHLIGASDGRRTVLVHAGDTVAQLLDAARAEYDVPLAAGTLRHAPGGVAWERGVLADAELTLSACGVRDGALLTVCADVRGGMEAGRETPSRPATDGHWRAKNRGPATPRTRLRPERVR